ncbi:MAG: efflux RND transporter periplasmic adaptor subunit [Pusillimonas sp.]
MKPSPRFSSAKTAVLLAISAVLAACGQAEQAPAAAAAPEVGVYTLREQALGLTTDLPGRTAAYRVAELRPQVTGIIQKRMFNEGAEVKQGQQLYQIDAAIYQAEYERARSNLVAAERLAKRYERLQKTSAISKQQYDDAYSSWKQAQAQAELARINLVYTKVLSPISGRIGRSAVTEGALVTQAQAQALATVQQLDPIFVDVTQPVSGLLRLQDELASGRLERSGTDQAKVTLQLEDGSAYPLAGSLKFSEVTVDQGTGSVTLRAEFPNPDGRLLPGMFVKAQLNEGVRNNAILVPQQAVQRDPTGQASVWVVDEQSRAQRRIVTTERTVGNQWLVSKGLKGGERVVTEGLQRLRGETDVVASEAGNVAAVSGFGAKAMDSAQPGTAGQAGEAPANAAQVAVNQ